MENGFVSIIDELKYNLTMKKLFTLMSIAALLLVGGCDDSSPEERPGDVVVEIPTAQLEELCKQMNTDISALQTIVGALQNGDCITDLSPVTKDGETTGYTVVFEKTEPVVISCGKSGDKEGHAPVVGVRQADGIYCWTLNGDWLTDGSGDKINAVGDATPGLRITDGYWEISCDAQTWTRLDKATGEDVNLIFASVGQDDDNVYFTLAYGSEIVVGKKKLPDTYVIEFEDSLVKKICVENWDTDNDGELSMGEARAVTTIGDKFKDSGIVSFKEFQYFTGVTSIEEEAFYHCRSLTSIAFPESITEIGYYALGGCSSVKNVYITDIAKWCAIKFIDDGVFVYDGSLYLNGELVTDLVIPKGVTEISSYAFCYCSSIESVTIPEGVTSIGEETFSYCLNLKNITLPESLAEIGSYAFRTCYNLENVYIKDIAKWCAIKFIDYCSNPLEYAKNLYLNGELVKDFVVPNSVTEIGSNAFRAYKGLTSLTLSESVTKIGSNAFNDCSSLTSITFPASVIEIGENVFSKCNNITGVYIADISKWCAMKFTSDYSNPLIYAHYLYLDGKQVTDLVIPDDVTRIGDRAFMGCNIPGSVTIHEGITEIGEKAFCSGFIQNGVYIADIAKWCAIKFTDGLSNPLGCANSLYLNGELITDLVIPDDVTEIVDNAFDGGSMLKSITIPDAVTTIGECAFAQCSGLESITIPSSVTNIGSSAFSSCTGECIIDCNIPDADNYSIFNYSRFSKITVGNSVTEIGDNAFKGCFDLELITIPSSVTRIGRKAFEDCTGECFIDCNIPDAKNSSSSSFDQSRFTKITIGDNVTEIGDNAFNRCLYMESVSISGNVTRIGDAAFMNSRNLTSVYCYIQKPLSIGAYTIPNLNKCTLYVPAGCKSAYAKATHWGGAKEIIEMQ